MNLNALAKQVKTKQLAVSRVVFEFDGKKWVFNSPVVVEADMLGNKVFQVMGNFSVEEDISEEDLKIIMEKTGCDKDRAAKALKKYGDLAEAILHIESGDV